MPAATGPGQFEYQVHPSPYVEHYVRLFNFDGGGDRLKPEHRRFLGTQLVPLLRQSRRRYLVVAGAAGVAGVAAPPTFALASAQFDPQFPLRPQPGMPWLGSGATPSGVPSEEISVKRSVLIMRPSTSAACASTSRRALRSAQGDAAAVGREGCPNLRPTPGEREARDLSASA